MVNADKFEIRTDVSWTVSARFCDQLVILTVYV